MSAFAGVVPMLIVFPIGLWISSQFYTIQKNIMAATDMRIETTNEVIINIRIINISPGNIDSVRRSRELGKRNLRIYEIFTCYFF